MSDDALSMALALVLLLTAGAVLAAWGVVSLARRLRLRRRVAQLQRTWCSEPSFVRPKRRRTLAKEDPRWIRSPLLRRLVGGDAGAAECRDVLRQPLRPVLMTGGVVGLTLVFAGPANLPPLTATVTALAVGIGFGAALVRARVRRRRVRFLHQLPEAIGILVRAVRAGVPVSEAMGEVGRELPPPVGETFRHVHERVSLGEPLDHALRRAAARIRLAELNFLCVTVAVQQETGGNLAAVLTELEQSICRRLAIASKARAASSEARASAAIMALLPFVAGGGLAVLAPGYLEPLWAQTEGRALVGLALGLLGTGAFVMSRMVRVRAS